MRTGKVLTVSLTKRVKSLKISLGKNSHIINTDQGRAQLLL